VGLAFGDALLPALEAVVDIAGPMVTVFADELTAALEAATAVAKPAADVLGFIAEAIGGVETESGKAAIGGRALGGVFSGVGRAALSTLGPVGGVASALSTVNTLFGQTADEAEASGSAVADAAVRAQAAEGNSLALRTSGWYRFVQDQIVNQQGWVAAVEANTARATAAFDSFLAAATSNIPSVAAEFDKLAADMGTDQVLANLESMFAATEQWTTDMETQIAAGNTNIVGLMAELGPEKSAILLGSYSGDLVELEAHLTRMFEAEQNARLRARQATVLHYLTLNGMTREGAERVVAQLGNSLLLEEPTLEAVQAAEAAVAESDLATIAGRVARDANEAARATVPEWYATGRDLANGFRQGVIEQDAAIRGAGAQMAVSAYLAAKSAAQSNSPSRLFASLGSDLAAGLVAGMQQAANSVKLEGETLVSVAAAPASAFQTQVQTAPTVAGANISVTVPVTVTGGMTPDDGRRIGEAAAVELRNVLMMEARVA
jgi:hypothetical protein